MPKYRFRWEALAPSVLRRLRSDLDLGQGNPAQQLRKTFGPRPDNDFVKVAWPSLLDTWLARDRAARRSVVAALRARRLGAYSVTPASVAAEIDYLRSCRNSAALREVVLEHLLAAGERSEVPKPARPAAPRAEAEDMTRERLMALVDGALEQLIDEDTVHHDEDGDVPIRYGSTMAFVRVAEDAPIVQVFAPVIWDVPSSAELLEAVNQLNSSIRFARARFDAKGGVTLAAEVPGVPFSADHVVNAVKAVGFLADEQTEPFQDRFGGRVFFGEAVPPKREPPTGGYL